MSSVVEILQDLGIDYREEGGHHHTRSGWVQVDCPLCSRDWKNFRLGINLYGVYASCWSCGYVNLVRALAELSGQPSGKIRPLIETIQKSAGADLDDKWLVRGVLKRPGGVKPLGPQHVRYLESRGFTDVEGLASLWQVQGIGMSYRLSWRLYIPVFYQGKEVSWTTRTIRAQERPRYISASPEEEELPHRDLLFGEDFVRHAVIVCEGPLDAMRIGPGAVATFGVAYSQRQVARMARFPLRYVCMDAEPLAQKKARELCRDLAVFPGRTTNIRLDSGKDPGECSLRELKELRRLLSR